MEIQPLNHQKAEKAKEPDGWEPPRYLLASLVLWGPKIHDLRRCQLCRASLCQTSPSLEATALLLYLEQIAVLKRDGPLDVEVGFLSGREIEESGTQEPVVTMTLAELVPLVSGFLGQPLCVFFKMRGELGFLLASPLKPRGIEPRQTFDKKSNKGHHVVNHISGSTR